MSSWPADFWNVSSGRFLAPALRLPPSDERIRLAVNAVWVKARRFTAVERCVVDNRVERTKTMWKLERAVLGLITTSVVTFVTLGSLWRPAQAAASVAPSPTFTPAPASADDWNHLTCLTFTGPVELPSVALPAGSYSFKIPDSVDRHIVQVFSGDGSQVLGTFLTIPEERLKPSDKTIVTFNEMPVGVPEAIRAWFYPWTKTGDEFVYPKDEAVKIAKATGQAVLSTTGPLASVADMKKASVARISATGQIETASKSVSTAPMKTLKPSKKNTSGLEDR
jgi:hypothetical protein